jgi:hypothetical protein
MVSKTAARIWAIEPKHLLLSAVMFENLRRCELTSWRRELFEHLMNRYSDTFVTFFRHCLLPKALGLARREASTLCSIGQDGKS